MPPRYRPKKTLETQPTPNQAYASLDADDFYYTEDGFMVFTAQYHLKRGYCCRNKCRHCPYGFKKNES